MTLTKAEDRPAQTAPLDARSLGGFVAAARREAGLTQRELAERLYVSDKTVSKWERGLSLPSVPLLVPLADALGVTISELMACERAPREGASRGEGTLGRAEADRLISTSLDMAGAHRVRARRRGSVVALAACGLAFGLEVALALGERDLTDGMAAGLACGGVSLLVALCFSLCPRELPGYYDENRLSYVVMGPLRLHMTGLRIHNGNWPAICQAFSVSGLAVALLAPAAAHLLGPAGNERLVACALMLASLAGLFVPAYVAGRRSA